MKRYIFKAQGYNRIPVKANNILEAKVIVKHRGYINPKFVTIEL